MASFLSSELYVLLVVCACVLTILAEVRLREYGAELVEVCDNGSGVQEQDFEGLGMALSNICFSP